MANKYNKLIKNTVIFSIGTFGSKVLSFLIVPFYTYVLTTSDYGEIDLFTTAIGLMTPFTTFLIQEALIRFMTAKEITPQIAASNCMFIFLAGVGFTILFYPIYNTLFSFDKFISLYILLLILTSYNQIFGQYLRAEGKIIAFSINGIIVTCITLLFNLVFVLIFRWGIKGYFYSLILAQFCASIQATVSGNILKRISLHNINFIILRDMLKYSIPLIPNNLMWWIMSAGDKYIISYYMGSSANGIYALALKIPTILSLVYSIFMQAWQLSAIEENNEKGQAVFYSNVFMATSALLTLLSSAIIVIIKPLYTLVISESFESAWKFTPMLCIATVINCYATFAGIVYIINKKSSKSFSTTFSGAIANIILNLLLIPRLGMIGVAIGTSVGYFLVFSIRARDAKSEIGMTFNTYRTITSILILVIQSIITLFFSGIKMYLMGAGCFLVIIILYGAEFIAIKKMIISKLRHKKP